MIFESGLRTKLPLIEYPVLILQSEQDMVVPLQVGDYLAAHIAHGSLKILDSQGHLPHLSAPAEVTSAIREFAAD